MKNKRILGLLFLAVPLLFSGCIVNLDLTDSETDGDYPVSIQLSNIPEGLEGNAIEIDVLERTGPLVRKRTGMIDSTIHGTTFSSTIKSYDIVYQRISDDDKLYTGDVELSFEVYIDVNGNSKFNDDNIDISDAINYEDITFTKESTYTINYSNLHVSGQ